MNIPSIKNRFFNIHKVKSKRCDYSSIDECPYSSTAECKFDKANCHIINNKRKKKTNPHSLLKVSLFGLSGLIVYVLITIASLDNAFAFTYSEYVYTIISGITISVVTGAILAALIDLPSRLKDYEQSFVNALSSNDYLKSLDEIRLTNLRNDITEQLHKTKAPNMAKGLIKIDQRVCELLRQPYYSRYRHTVICENSSKPDFIKKEHIIEYKLINPYSVNQTAIEFIKFTNLVLIKEDDKPNDSINNLKISCRIDNRETQDLSNRIDFNFEDITNEFYNKKITITDKENKSNQKGIKVEFDDNIEVEMRYTIYVHKNDPCFTKRLQHPAKNFRLDYTCNDDKIELYGQIFGTELKQSDISIKYTSNSISLETFDWLLPDNGAIVVMLKK